MLDQTKAKNPCKKLPLMETSIPKYRIKQY